MSYSNTPTHTHTHTRAHGPIKNEIRRVFLPTQIRDIHIYVRGVHCAVYTHARSYATHTHTYTHTYTHKRMNMIVHWCGGDFGIRDVCSAAPQSVLINKRRRVVARCSFRIFIYITYIIFTYTEWFFNHAHPIFNSVDNIHLKLFHVKCITTCLRKNICLHFFKSVLLLYSLTATTIAY